VPKPDVLPVCRDAVRERVRPADPLKFRGDVAVIQVGIVTALAADELICIGISLPRRVSLRPPLRRLKGVALTGMATKIVMLM
jgi:hypothetical protein